MWKYIPGVKPPQKKIQTKEDKSSYQKDYDKTKRARKFEQKWCVGRPWLTNTMNGMTCKACIGANDTGKLAPKRPNTFIEGCDSGRLESVELHEASKYHQSAHAWWITSKMKPGETPVEKSFSKLGDDVKTKMDKLFRTCHALAKHNRPLSDYSWQCDLDCAKGINLGSTYMNRTSATEFSKYIADDAFMKIANKISSAKFVCVMGDGSTDISSTEQEMWFCRICKKGAIDVSFIGSSSQEKADAESIYKSLRELVIVGLDIEWSTFVQKLVVASMDGASVMMGCKTGVAARLKEDQPCVIPLHCMAHRLELAYKDGTKKIKLYEKSILTLSMGLYYFYQRSPLNRTNLKRAATVLKTKVKFPTRVCGTRWVGHLNRALTNITHGYGYIVMHLEQLQSRNTIQSSKAKCFLKLMKNRSVACFLYFLLDVTTALKKLSTTLQETKCVVGEVSKKVSGVLAILDKYIESDGPHLRKVINEDVINGVELSGNLSEFNSSRKAILQNLVQAIKARFSDLEAEGVINATSIACTSNWPAKGGNFKDYGDEELKVIIDHFRPVLLTNDVDPDEAEVEWSMLKTGIYSCKNAWDVKYEGAIVKDWTIINQMFGKDYPNILSVIDLILCMSPSSAEVERGFTQLKLVKTDRRNALSGDNLSRLLGIKLLTPSVKEYDPSDSIDLWWKNGIRRPHFQDKKLLLKEKLLTEDQVEEGIPQTEQSLSEPGPSQPHEQSQPTVQDAQLYQLAVTAAAEEFDSFNDSDSGLESDLAEETVFKRLLSK